MIDFRRVHYRYPRQEGIALQDVNFTVEDGSYLLVTGRSGSGKSSLARCLNGLVPHFHGGAFGGRVTVGDLDTRLATTARLSTISGFVAQDPESQTVTDRVADEIAFGCENLGLSTPEIRLRVEEALDLLGVTALRDRTLTSLSGGERQRVVIAAAMAMRPPILTLDEPTSQLDPWGAEEVLSAIEQLNANLGLTVIIVEHRLERLLGAVDDILLLGDQGNVAAYGAVDQVLPNLPDPPAFVSVARALGWQPLPRTIKEARRLRARLGPPDAELPPLTAETATVRPATVELDRVSFGYGREPVLNDLRLTFGTGQVTALMGRNGSGKSTLLKLINGLLRPQSGQVRLFGDPTVNRSTADLARQVGYLPQNPGALLFNRTVADELRFTLRAQRRKGGIEETLKLLGIRSLANRNPLDISGGERQRVALGAVLVTRPPVLLLDEPTRGMDAVRKQELADLLHHLSVCGSSVVLATHDVELVARVADRVVLLGGGNIVADGGPREVLTGSLTYSTQINRVFGGGRLTPEDVLND